MRCPTLIYPCPEYEQMLGLIGASFRFNSSKITCFDSVCHDVSMLSGSAFIASHFISSHLANTECLSLSGSILLWKLVELGHRNLWKRLTKTSSTLFQQGGSSSEDKRLVQQWFDKAKRLVSRRGLRGSRAEPF